MRSRSIHAMTRSAKRSISASVSSLPWGRWCHLAMHPRQHVAVACCAVNTGCPRHGVWRPSLRGFAAPMRARSSSRAWRSIMALPFARAYARSFADNSNYARNEERESRFSVSSIHRRSAPSSASSGKTRSISPSIPHTSAQPTPAYISPTDQAAADWG